MLLNFFPFSFCLVTIIIIIDLDLLVSLYNHLMDCGWFCLGGVAPFLEARWTCKVLSTERYTRISSHTLRSTYFKSWTIWWQLQWGRWTWNSSYIVQEVKICAWAYAEIVSCCRDCRQAQKNTWAGTLDWVIFLFIFFFRKKNSFLFNSTHIIISIQLIYQLKFIKLVSSLLYIVDVE